MDCPRCRGLKTVDPALLEHAQQACAELLKELVIWANESKVDHRKMPVLTELATVIRIIESL